MGIYDIQWSYGITTHFKTNRQTWFSCSQWIYVKNIGQSFQSYPHMAIYINQKALPFWCTQTKDESKWCKQTVNNDLSNMNSPTNSSILTLTTRLLFVQVIKFGALSDGFPEVNARFPYLRIHLCKFQNSNIHYRNVTHSEKFKSRNSIMQADNSLYELLTCSAK